MTMSTSNPRSGRETAQGESNPAARDRAPSPSSSDRWPLQAALGDLRADYGQCIEAEWDEQTVMETLFAGPKSRRMIGRFEITRPEPIGGGGMGRVFEGWDSQLDRRVAIKLLDRSFGPAQERFVREGRALARLSHPNIVQVHEVGQHDGTMFIAMEYVEGRTLREWVADERPWTEVVRAYLDAGRGLAAAHAAGMVHRDFKPDNAMIGSDQRVRVLDFGLARTILTTVEDGGAPSRRTAPDTRSEERGSERLTLTGTVLGTVPYMAPEQHQGRRVTEASDQYSFCVSLFEALQGTRPFGGSTRLEIFDAILERRWQRSSWDAGVPRRIAAAVRRGLAVEPEGRWPSMEALLEELRSVFRIKRRRLLGAGVLLGALPAAGALWIGASDQDPCAIFEPRAQGVLPGTWDEEHKTAISRAFEDTGARFAASSWSVVEEGIERWAVVLGQGQRDACQAHHVDHEQSAEAMDLRMTCLHRRHAGLHALVEVLASADAEVVRRAPEAILQLPRIEDCEDIEQLRARVPGPPQAVAAEVQQARLSIDRAEAMLWAGRHGDGLAEARLALQLAERAEYRPVASEARLVLGMLELKVGAPVEGIETLERSAHDALRDGHDEVAARAWSWLARFAAPLQVLDDGRRWLLEAEVMYERLGHRARPDVQAELTWNEANLARLAGDLPEAELRLRRVEAYRRRVAERGEDPRARLLLALTLDDLANVVHDRGRYDESIAIHTEGLELHTALLGEHHPRTGRFEYNLGAALRDAGHPGDALRHFGRALVVVDPEASVDLGRLHRAIAGVHHDQGRLDEATWHTRRAQQIIATALPQDHPEQASVWDALGVLAYSRGRLDESVTAYQRALSILERIYGPEHAQLGQTSSNLGESLVALGRFEQALPRFDLADRLLVRDRGRSDPDRVYPLKGRGLALLGLGRVEPAIETLQHARMLCPPTARTECGEIALGLALAVADSDREGARALAARARHLLSDEAGTTRMKILLRAMGDAAKSFDELR